MVIRDHGDVVIEIGVVVKAGDWGYPAHRRIFKETWKSRTRTRALLRHGGLVGDAHEFCSLTVLQGQSRAAQFLILAVDLDGLAATAADADLGDAVAFAFEFDIRLGVGMGVG